MPDTAIEEQTNGYPTAVAGRRFPCARCGAKLRYEPNTREQHCPYCGHINPIVPSLATIEELNYELLVEQGAGRVNLEREIALVKCDACAAEIEKPPQVTSLSCPYCGSNIVMTTFTKRQLLPQALLPFRIKADDARARFKKWLKGLWFAPNALKKTARVQHKLAGIYVPYWTYDARTKTRYSGMRGDAYYVPVTYTVTVNGKTQTRTRMERRIRWTPVSGTVRDDFDDVLVVASRSLPREHVEAIDPWDLPSLIPYQDEYLSGFAAECYQVDLVEGLGLAKNIMAGEIRASVIHDIGGDHQQIHSLNTTYRDITFKHILLPIWISAYRFRKKIYRFVVNARTGEVRGDRPWSWIKITLAILVGLALAAAGAYIYTQTQR